MYNNSNNTTTTTTGGRPAFGAHNQIFAHGSVPPQPTPFYGPGHWTAASGMQMAMAYPVAEAGPVDHDLALPVDPNVIIHNTAHARPLAWRDEDAATAVIAQNKSVCTLIDLVGKL